MKTKKIHISLFLAAVALSANAVGADEPYSTPAPSVIVSVDAEPVTQGPFQPTWKSLEQYKVPQWYRNAKFGIWAHWGPQCQPERGDWYARWMYLEGISQYKDHISRWGHPSVTGFKDIIHEWKAEKWDPDHLVALYKRVGAQYFVAMGNHHDNFDLWSSKYQPWNAANIGPQKDLIAGWAKAARKQGLPFGVSIHAAWARTFYQYSTGADKTGSKIGTPYDGNLTKEDGKGQWWDGLDPQELYAQKYPAGSNSDLIYVQRYYNRVADLIKNYHPDLIYFDDDGLPFWPTSDAGLKIAADFYNTNLARTHGKSNGVLFGKSLTEQQRKCLTWDVERGVMDGSSRDVWQTDTCIGNWHYDRSLYDNNGYKSAKNVIQILADIVSKNGNLLLNIPVRGDGSIDEKEEAMLEELAAWMDVNKQAIFGTRPWKIFGEGSATVVNVGADNQQPRFNENTRKSLGAEDVRFTVGKNGSLYVIELGRPDKALTIKSLGIEAAGQKVVKVNLLGSSEHIQWRQVENEMTIEPPQSKLKSELAIVYKITFKRKIDVQGT